MWSFLASNLNANLNINVVLLMQLLLLSKFSLFCDLSIWSCEIVEESLVKMIVYYNDRVIKIHRKYYCRDMAEQYIAEN